MGGIYVAAMVMEVIMALGSPDYQGGISVLVILGAASAIGSLRLIR